MQEIPEITIHEAADLAAAGAMMLDVREPDEWRAGHMAGAVHMPLGDLDPSSIEARARIVAVCRSGNRSGKATLALAEAGHDVVNMAGGMLAWRDAGLPIVADNAEPGTV